MIFSLDAFKKHHPQYSAYYRHVVKAEKIGDREIKFTFDAPGNRELPQIVGQLTVLPKHWWEGTDSEGRKRDISATTLEKPLGSGPYRIKEFVAGRSVTLERVKDHWGRDLNVNIGRNNFDELRYEYFRDSIVALEAFKGDQVDWRTENSAKNWATAYDFPAVADKRVLLEEFPNRSSGIMQAFAMNLRRDKFSDPRVRRALNFAFDFEEMNKQIFFGQYKRINSYFDGTELASSGLPQGKELEILETVRSEVPAEVFTTAYTNPVGGSPEAVRENLREATAPAQGSGLRGARPQAGRQQDRQRRSRSNCLEPIPPSSGSCCSSSHRWSGSASTSACAPSIRRNMRTGCAAGISISSCRPGANRCRRATSSANSGARRPPTWPGSRNIIGIKNPAIDKLIERLIFAKDRDDLVAATKALDRVLLWNHYVVPQWTYPKVAYRALGSLRPAGRTAEIRPVGIPGDLVVRRRQGRAGSANGLEGHSAHGAIRPPARARSRRRRAERGAASSAAGARCGRPRRHGLSVFGELKYPADFHHFDYVNVAAPKGGMFSQLVGATIVYRPSIRSMPTSSRAMARTAWT